MLPITHTNNATIDQMRAEGRNVFITKCVIVDIAIVAITHFASGLSARHVLRGAIAGNVIAYYAIRYFFPDEML